VKTKVDTGNFRWGYFDQQRSSIPGKLGSRSNSSPERDRRYAGGTLAILTDLVLWWVTKRRSFTIKPSGFTNPFQLSTEKYYAERVRGWMGSSRTSKIPIRLKLTWEGERLWEKRLEVGKPAQLFGRTLKFSRRMRFRHFPGKRVNTTFRVKNWAGPIWGGARTV